MSWPFSFSTILSLLDSWRSSREFAHTAVSDDSDSDVEIADSTPDTAGPAIRERRAWCGLASLANPERDVAFAKSIGLTGLDIIVNDHSAAREPRPFDARPTQRIVTLAKMARDAGLDVHLMSWIMPHTPYLREAAVVLPELVEKTGALSLCWDAEEPWTLAKKRLSYSDAGALVAELFADRSFELGVTGIRYASAKKLGPLIMLRKRHPGAPSTIVIARGKNDPTDLEKIRSLAAVCDYIVPQCYSTSSSKAPPSTVVSKGLATWRKKFGDDPRFVPGLAAYRQSGIKGHSIGSAMQAAIDDADDHTDAVIYWGLNSLRKSPRTAAAVAALAITPEPR